MGTQLRVLLIAFNKPFTFPVVGELGFKMSPSQEHARTSLISYLKSLAWLSSPLPISDCPAAPTLAQEFKAPTSLNLKFFCFEEKGPKIIFFTSHLLNIAGWLTPVISTWEMEVGRSGAQSQHRIHSKFSVSPGYMRYCLKNKTKRN